MAVTGLGFLGTTIKSPVSKEKKERLKNESKNSNSKYLSITTPGIYRIRLVSGFVPYLTHYIPPKNANEKGRYIISPRSLLLDVEKEYEPGKTRIERLHVKPDGTNYSETEAFCPTSIEQNKDPQMKYAINVIDRDAQRADPEGIVPVKILIGPYSALFEKFFNFQGIVNDFPPFDMDKGPDFVIKTEVNTKGKGVTYSVDYFKDASPLTEKERVAVGKFKYSDQNDKMNGVWDLVTEYHPFKCPLSMRCPGVSYDESPNYRHLSDNSGSDNSQSRKETSVPIPQTTRTAEVLMSTQTNVSEMTEQISRPQVSTVSATMPTSIEDIMAELNPTG